MTKDRVILERRFIPKGSIIIHEGDDAYSAYLIQSGEVSVYAKQDGKEIELARIGMGQICGEMALINEDKRNASVRAIEDCTVIVITRTSFEEKLKNCDPTIQAIIKMMIARIKTANAQTLNRTSEVSDLMVITEQIYKNMLHDADMKTTKRIETALRPALDKFLEVAKKIKK